MNIRARKKVIHKMDKNGDERLSGATVADESVNKLENLSDNPDQGEKGLELPESLESSENLDMVRKILFGEQVRETERKQASLERHIRVSVDALNVETQKQIEAIKSELGLLSGALDKEVRNRKADVATGLERFTNVEQTINRMGNQARTEHHELRQRLTQESLRIDEKMSDWRKDILEQLEKASNDLKHDKADRKTVAGLLQEMAKQLANEGAPEPTQGG